MVASVSPFPGFLQSEKFEHVGSGPDPYFTPHLARPAPVQRRHCAGPPAGPNTRPPSTKTTARQPFIGRAQLAVYRRRLLELSATVTTHPYWESRRTW
ncbi:hypothetical protein [Streptomyces sp. NPDC058240]|uniref:hypothetical protein n=1 Tax=Streptomyces sp. NPDC058240 TaxID=3346396 RepID=UPI0036EA143D